MSSAYYHMLRNMPEERRYHLFCGRSPKSRKKGTFSTVLKMDTWWNQEYICQVMCCYSYSRG